MRTRGHLISQLDRHAHIGRILGPSARAVCCTIPHQPLSTCAISVVSRPEIPKMDGTHLSLRFKHGLHTIFLFVDPLQPVSAMTTQLLDVLRERYPDGELQTTQGPTHIPAPDDDEVKLVYGKLKNPGDPTEGWQRLELKGSDTPSRKGITDGMVLAFAVVGEGDEDVEFAVDWPNVGDELEEGDETIGPA